MNVAIANQFTKEAIKSRMLQHAANLWGVKNPNALDPFVRLLVEAFSTEIYRASNETQNIEGRILDKIARMLTPNLLTMPKPAHGILLAMPVGAAAEMNGSTKFTTQKRWAAATVGDSKNDEIQIAFCPVGTTHLVNGRVAYIATSYQLFSFDTAGFKHSQLRTNQPFPAATCLVGIKLNKKVSDLKGVALYFDFPSHESNAWIYQLLSLVKISCNGAEVSTTSGIINQEDGTQSLGQQIFSDYDLMGKIKEEILQQYAHKFITILDCRVDHKPTGYPDLLLTHFSETQLQGKVSKDTIWLELKFPPNYDYEVLSNCSIAINAFPVLNKNLITNTYSYKGLNNILPLRTEAHERFMAIERVTDAVGREYFELPYNRSGGQTGFYSVRHGGVERFDQRSAQDMVNYLLELTRDEVAAFSSLDQTFIRSSLESLLKQLKQIQNKSHQVDKFIKQSPGYLVIEPVDAEENIQVEYWVTQGVEANQLRPGTEFHCQNNNDIITQGAVLLSETFGGREQLKIGERIDACRYALGSRNRLITREDIRNFCKTELGKKLKAVHFKPGIETSAHPRHGYIRTLEVLLQPASYHELQAAEWQTMANNLLIKIRNLSPDGIHYRIRVVADE